MPITVPYWIDLETEAPIMKEEQLAPFLVCMPTDGAEHYLSYEGAKHLGACSDALEEWRNEGKDIKFPAWDIPERFRRYCPMCFATSVMCQLRELVGIDADMSLSTRNGENGCRCGWSNNSMPLSDEEYHRLEHLLRCIIETACKNRELVMGHIFHDLG